VALALVGVEATLETVFRFVKRSKKNTNLNIFTRIQEEKERGKKANRGAKRREGRF
jgi:hypothetical protein